MRKSWRKVAEFADNCAFDPDQVSEAFERALCEEWTEQVLARLIRRVGEILAPERTTLSKEMRFAQLEALRVETAGRELGTNFLACAMRAYSKGFFGEKAITDAVNNALKMWVPRHCRQIEEHYKRKVGPRRVENVRNRLASAAAAVDFQRCASQLLKIDGTVKRTGSLKRTGVDDGVSIGS
jgi:hypothetical protein